MPGKRRPGSLSFTPFGHRSHSRPQSHRRPHSHSRSSTPGQSCCRDSAPHTSRKRPVAKTPRLTEATPTQSPTQKTPKLKSLVQRAPATKNYHKSCIIALTNTPRNSSSNLWEIWIGRLVTWRLDAWQPSIHLAHRVIVSTITTLVAANQGIHFLVPFIPRELMSSLNNPTDAEPPGAPARSDDSQTDVRVHCVWEWTYLMCLLQYWYNASLVYTYGGPVRQESKLMLFIFYRINAMLNPYGLYIRLHEVMDNTPWLSYYQARTQLEQCIADYESHLHVIKELLRNWLKNRYLVEATVEWRHLQLHRGSLDRLPFPHSYEDE